MKKITLLLIFCLAFSINSYGQCTTNTGGQWPSSTVTLTNTGGIETIATNNWPNAEFSVIEGVLPGSDYTVDANPSLYVTVTNTADNTVIVHGVNPVSFVAPAGVTGITIYWHIDAACTTINSGNTATTIQCTTCICTETVAPDAVLNPAPLDGATDVILVGGGTTFEWDDSLSVPAESYTISIGTTVAADEIGSLTDVTSGTNITFGGADNATYFWRIDAINCFGTTAGTVWSFNTIACPETAAPSCPAVIAPVDGELAAQISDDGSGTGSVNISWNPITDVNSYQITFDGNVLGNTSLTSLNITGLDLATSYTWSIEPINCFGTATGCTTWAFTTDAALLSVDDFENRSFNHFYNKTTGELSLESDNNSFTNIDLYNILGQQVMTRELSNTNEVINLNGLTDGIYIAKVSIGDNTRTIKFVK